VARLCIYINIPSRTMQEWNRNTFLNIRCTNCVRVKFKNQYAQAHPKTTRGERSVLCAPFCRHRARSEIWALPGYSSSDNFEHCTRASPLASVCLPSRVRLGVSNTWQQLTGHDHAAFPTPNSVIHRHQLPADPTGDRTQPTMNPYDTTPLFLHCEQLNIKSQKYYWC